MATTKTSTKKTASTAKKAVTGSKTTSKKTSTKKQSAVAKSNQHADAITVLKADHQRVTDLFDKFEGLGKRAHRTRESTVGGIIKELSVHAGIEETVFYPAVRERFEQRNTSMVLEALEEHHLVKLTLNEHESMTSESERYDARMTVLRRLRLRNGWDVLRHRREVGYIPQCLQCRRHTSIPAVVRHVRNDPQRCPGTARRHVPASNRSSTR